MSDPNAHKVLVDGRNVLLRTGWTQYAILDPSGRVCLSGAMYIASPLHCSKAMTVLASMVGSPIANWNDAPGRTLNQVLQVLDQAIAATAPKSLV